MSTKQHKFRVWDGKTMHDDGFHMDQDGLVFECYDTGPGGSASSERLPNLLVLEYSGVKDDNGAELYYDDVVDTELGRALIGFQHGFFCLNWLEVDGSGSEANVELLGSDWKGRKREKLVRLGSSLEKPELKVTP